MKVSLSGKNQVVEIPDGLAPEQAEKQLMSYYSYNDLNPKVEPVKDATTFDFNTTDGDMELIKHRKYTEVPATIEPSKTQYNLSETGTIGITPSTFPEREKYRWQKGQDTIVKEGRAYWKAMTGSGDDWDEADKITQENLKKYTPENDDRYNAKNWAEKFAGASTELAPYMMSSGLEGLRTGVMYGAAAGLVTGGAGVAPGYTLGQTVGTLKNAIEIEGGQIYKQLRLDGVEKESAQTASFVGGSIIGLIEVAQLGHLWGKYIPGGKKGVVKAISKFAKAKVSNKLAQAIGKFAKRMIIFTSLEIGEEEAQEVVGWASEVAAHISMMAKFGEEYDGPGFTDKDGHAGLAARMKETALQSLMAFPLLGLPHSIYSTAMGTYQDVLIDRVMTFRGNQALELELTDKISEAMKYKNYKDYYDEVGSKLSDEEAKKHGFDNGAFLAEALYNAGKRREAEEEILKSAEAGQSVEEEGDGSLEQEVMETIGEGENIPPAIKKIRELATVLGVRLGEIKISTKENVLNPFDPKDLEKIKNNGYTIEQVKELVANGQKFIIRGTHTLVDGPSGQRRSDITLYRGYTDKTVYHEFAHGVEEQGGLPGWAGTAEQHADYLEELLNEGKEHTLVEFTSDGSKVDNGVYVTPGAIAVDQNSIRTVDSTKETTARLNTKISWFTPKQIANYFSDLNNVMAFITANKDLLDFVPSEYFDSLKSNSDKQYRKSLDFTTMCIKRYIMQATVDKIQMKLKRPLNADEFMKIRELLMKHDVEHSCGACYVDSRRINMGTILDKAIAKFSYGLDIKGKDRETVRAEIEAAQDSGKKPLVPLKYFLTMDGLDRLSRERPDIYEEMRKLYSGSQIKIPEARTEYRGDILKISTKLVNHMNEASGLRWQSWSDFELPHLLDAMQAIGDMSLKKLKGHAYTKVEIFARIFAPTGMMINASLIPKGTGFDKNGKLIWDSKQSFPYKAALELRAKYPNFGTVAIGISDAHIKALMADPNIDYIIPYHSSGLSKVNQRLLGMDGWEDYSDFQNFTTKKGNKTGKKIFINEYRGNLKKLAEIENKKGIVSPFKNFRKIPGYEKLVTDRRIYDNGGHYQEQQIVQPTFDMVEANKALQKYVKEGGTNTAPNDDVVGEFLAQERVKYKIDTENAIKGVNINDGEQGFTEQILSGEKTIETRDSNSLNAYINTPVGIIQTGKGIAKLVGYAIFGEPKIYKDEKAFRKDVGAHRIEPGNKYDIKPGSIKYGYPVLEVAKIDPIPVTSRGIVSRDITTYYKIETTPSDGGVETTPKEYDKLFSESLQIDGKVQYMDNKRSIMQYQRHATDKFMKALQLYKQEHGGMTDAEASRQLQERAKTFNNSSKGLSASVTNTPKIERIGEGSYKLEYIDIYKKDKYSWRVSWQDKGNFESETVENLAEAKQIAREVYAKIEKRSISSTPQNKEQQNKIETAPGSATQATQAVGRLNRLVEESDDILKHIDELERIKKRMVKKGMATKSIENTLIELAKQYDVIDSQIATILTVSDKISPEKKLSLQARDLEVLERKIIQLTTKEIKTKTISDQKLADDIYYGKKLARQKEAILKAKSERDSKINELKNNIIDYANNLKKEDRGSLLTAIRDVTTLKGVLKTINRIDDIAERSRKRAILKLIHKQVRRIKKSKSIAIDYIQRMEDFLKDYELQGHTKGKMASLKATLEYVEKQKAEGKPVEVPDYVLESLKILARKPLDELKSADLENILDQIKLFADTGKLKLRTREAVEKFKKIRDLQAIQKSSKAVNARAIKRGNAITGKLSQMDKIGNAINTAMNVAQTKDLVLHPMDALFDYLDGAQNYLGANYRIFKRTIDTAFSEYLDAKNDMNTRADEKAKELKLDAESMERIGLHAARMQKGGMEKLLMAFEQKDIDSVVLTPQENEFYQFMRSELDDLRPRIETLMRTVYNKPLGQVENYFPFMVDFDAMNDMQVQDMFGSNPDLPMQAGQSLKKNVEMGFTIARVKAAYALKLNAAEIYGRHIDNALYLINVGKHTKYLGELARTKEYGAAVGDVGQALVREWVDLIAMKGNSDGRVGVLDHMRKATGILALGLKIGSTLIQITSLGDAATLIGGNAFVGLRNVVSSREWRAFVIDTMPEVRNRIGDDQAFAEFAKDKWAGMLGKIAFMPLQTVDRLMATATAAGAYVKYCKDNNIPIDLARPDMAGIAYAQQMMRRTQSSSQFKDSPLAISKGKLTGKLGKPGNISLDKAVLQFQSFMLNRWSIIRHDLWRHGIKGGNPKEAANIVFWLAIANMAENGIRQLTSDMIASAMGKEPEDDDDEQKQTIKTIGSILSNVPFMGSTFYSMVYGGGIPIPSFETVRRLMARFWNATSGMFNEEVDEKFVPWLRFFVNLLPGGQQIEKFVKSEE